MIIKIKAYENGSHANQSTNPGFVPEGWAIVPDNIKIPETFPFVDIKVEEQDGVMVVVKMTPGIVPEPEEIKPEPTTEELLNIILGVHE